MRNTTIFRTVFTSFLMMYFVSNLNAQGIIRTIAGTGVGGSSGDGFPAIFAELSSPSGVAVDHAGNIYIADRGNSKIRQIQAVTGIMYTIAGTTWGYSGMGGPAPTAQIMMPNAIFVDASNNYYFTDWYNDAAFRVDGATNIFTNYCGHHTQGYGGDGGDASIATMEIPNGIWKDNVTGHVYIVDAGSNHLRKVDAATHIVSTIAGGAYGYSGDGGPLALAQFSGISGVCVDHHGNMFISDGGNNCIRKVETSGIVHTIAGTGVAGYSGDGGSGQTAQFNSPGALFINNAGYLFICDIGNNVVRVLNTNLDMIYTLAGTGTMGFSGDLGPATAAQLAQPTGVWQDNTGSIYIADNGNQRIRMVTGAGYKTSPNLSNEIAATHFNMYPNPTTGNFTLETSTSVSNTTIEVYNIFGIKVLNQNMSGQTASINLNQPAGIYTVMISSENGVEIQKLTIQ